MSFENPVVGGTVLRIPAIQSPNFTMGPPLTGWAIYADGDAYFGDITASGTVTGSSVVVDGANGGVFVYSGTPASGNLIVSIAGAAGVDAYGNTYPEGINVTTGTIAGSTITGSTITGTTFDGTDFMIDSAGVFFYSGTPAAGNLILALAPAAGTDAYGNSYSVGLTAGAAGTNEQIVIGVYSGSPLIYFLSAISTALNNAAFMLNVSGAGSAEHDTLVLKSSQDTSHTDYTAINLNGNSHDGTTAKTSLTLAYVDTTGAAHFYLTVNSAGLFANGNLTIGATAALGDNGSGELALADASTVPTTDPVGGGVLYAKQGVPSWRDTGGNLLGMIRSYYKRSTSDLNTFTAETLVPGTSTSVVVTGSNATLIAVCDYDMEAGTGACTLTGIFNWNGSDQTEMGIFSATAAGQRATVAQTYVITGITSGTYTAELKATCTVSGAANAVKATHTGYTLILIDQ
jgi:hypothetical protein